MRWGRLYFSSSPSRTSLRVEAQDLAPQEAMAIVIMVTSRLQLWGDGVNGQKPLPKGTQALSLLSLMDVPPLIAKPFFPTENSLGRRGASSRLRSAGRQSRTVLHRLTGHFGRRGQGGMKTNVSPVSTPTSPRHVSEAPLLLCPCFLVCPISLQWLVPLSAVPHVWLSALSHVPPHLLSSPSSLLPCD